MHIENLVHTNKHTSGEEDHTNERLDQEQISLRMNKTKFYSEN